MGNKQSDLIKIAYENTNLDISELVEEGSIKEIDKFYNKKLKYGDLLVSIYDIDQEIIKDYVFKELLEDIDL